MRFFPICVFCINFVDIKDYRTRFTELKNEKVPCFESFVEVKNTDVGFEVFTAVTMKNAVFLDVMPCGSCKNRRFGGTYRLLLRLLVTAIVVPNSLILVTLIVEKVSSCETSVLNRSTRRIILEIALFLKQEIYVTNRYHVLFKHFNTETGHKSHVDYTAQRQL
jgi:hypothetical protein